MVTSYNSRSSVTTSYSSREPIGIVYLEDDFWNILTDDFGQGLYISQTNTQYTTRPQIVRGDSMPVIESWYWDDTKLWDDSKLWNDSISLWTPYSSRPSI